MFAVYKEGRVIANIQRRKSSYKKSQECEKTWVDLLLLVTVDFQLQRGSKMDL